MASPPSYVYFIESDCRKAIVTLKLNGCPVEAHVSQIERCEAGVHIVVIYKEQLPDGSVKCNELRLLCN